MKDNVVLVTGGSRGIGFAVAERFAAEGARLVITYRNETQGLQAADALRARGAAHVLGVVCDSSDAASVEELFKTVDATFGRLDVLVNNAGVTRDTLVLRMKDEDWDQVLDTNLKGAFLFCRAAVRRMLKARAGRIINIASVVGLTGNAGQVNYSASKGGLIAMTKSLAKEVGSRGITVNAVAPGYIETEMTHGLAEGVKEALLANIALGRLGAAKDVAEAVHFLAGPGSAYITGHTLSVNGGLAMI